MGSLGLTLLAAFGSLCCFGEVGLVLGAVALLGGFGCFFFSRDEGSGKDLVVGIAGMLTGFLIIAYSIYGLQLGAQDGSDTFATDDEMMNSSGFPKIFGDDEPQTTRPAPEDPFAVPEKNLPQPTRPATKAKKDRTP